MLKIAVVDCGLGGEKFARCIEEQNAAVEVIRVIDWNPPKPYAKMNRRELRARVEAQIRPYVGRVKLIVLWTNFVATSCLGYFRKKFPEQNFCGAQIQLNSGRTEKVVVLTSRAMKRSAKYREFRRSVPGKVMEVCCEDWLVPVNTGEITDAKMLAGLQRAVRFGPGLVILGCSFLVFEERVIREAFGEDVTIDNGLAAGYCEVCRGLGLLGVDGRTRRGV